MPASVLDEKVKGRPRLRWKTVGTTHYCRFRLGPEQVDGHCS